MRCFSNLSCHFGSYPHSQMHSLAPRQERICVFTPRTLSYIIYRYQFSLCEGSTIELLANVEGEYTIEKACTIVTNGKTITVEAGTDFNMASADGKYTFTAKVYVAQVGTTRYETWAEAYAAGTEITLLAPINDATTLDKACTIDTKGFAFNYTVDESKGLRATKNGNIITVKLAPITLIPGDFWKIANARFAAYFFNNATSKNEWVSLTANNGQYSCDVPSGDWEKVIFCRMNPANNTNSWDNVWNQTADLDIMYGQYFHVVGWTDIAQWSKTTTRPTVSVTISNKYIFFEPSTKWKEADARFAVYSYDNNGNKWTDMQKVNDNLYYVYKSDLKNTIIFVRMNPSSSDNNWDNDWAQTGDLTITNNNNKCKMTDTSGWGNGVSWSKITTF